MMRFLNVLQNGNVYADGVHDDTKALQACIDELREGGTVYFPDGTYLISGALIFYSYQTLKFSDNAVILRSDTSEPLTRYLLASYSEREWGGYEGTHDVVISGGIFDGNPKLDEKITIVNTVHCSNITIENCRFRHCAHWHCIEINGTEKATIQNCIFDGPSYTFKSERLYNEQIQLDMSRYGAYGPVYDYEGKLIDFCSDDTPCRSVVIRNNIFKCDGFPGIGHHGDIDHHDIVIEGNIFDGPSGSNGMSRGYIIFRPQVYNVKIVNNAFLAPEGETNSPNAGVIIENPDPAAVTEADNVFVGNIEKRFIQG